MRECNLFSNADCNGECDLFLNGACNHFLKADDKNLIVCNCGCNLFLNADGKSQVNGGNAASSSSLPGERIRSKGMANSDFGDGAFRGKSWAFCC
jgi:hypothetical protein